MKVGIVGCGFVGATTAYTLVMKGIGREIVLVDLDHRRAEAEADDIRHAIPFAYPMMIHAGSYADLAGSSVVIIAAGVGQKPGETRLQLLERNASVFRDVIPSVLEYAADAVLLVATNPVDIMTHVAAHFAAQHDVPSSRVIGSGTMLDTARFRTLLGDHFGVDARHVHGYVIGEHGDSEVLTWSLMTIGGLRLADVERVRQVSFDGEIKAQIDRRVRGAAYKIIAGKNATYYGIGAALAQIVNAIIHDQRAILTISSRIDGVLGIEGVTLALPTLVGGRGAMGTLPIRLADDEMVSFHASAAVIQNAIDSLQHRLE